MISIISSTSYFNINNYGEGGGFTQLAGSMKDFTFSITGGVVLATVYGSEMLLPYADVTFVDVLGNSVTFTSSSELLNYLNTTKSSFICTNYQTYLKTFKQADVATFSPSLTLISSDGKLRRIKEVKAVGNACEFTVGNCKLMMGSQELMDIKSVLSGSVGTKLSYSGYSSTDAVSIVCDSVSGTGMIGLQINYEVIE